MTIKYNGRDMQCFAARNGCKKKAEVRMETRYLCLHMCQECGDAFAERLRKQGRWATVTPLSRDGLDMLEANTLDDEGLRKMPHVKEVT